MANTNTKNKSRASKLVLVGFLSIVFGIFRRAEETCSSICLLLGTIVRLFGNKTNKPCLVFYDKDLRTISFMTLIEVFARKSCFFLISIHTCICVRWSDEREKQNNGKTYLKIVRICSIRLFVRQCAAAS